MQLARSWESTETIGSSESQRNTVPSLSTTAARSFSHRRAPNTRCSGRAGSGATCTLAARSDIGGGFARPSGRRAAPATPNRDWCSPQGASSVAPRVGPLNRCPVRRGLDSVSLAQLSSPQQQASCFFERFEGESHVCRGVSGEDQRWN
jgi:hypothetical protein